MWFIQVQHGAQRIRRDLPERLSEKVRVYNQGVDGLTRSLHVYFVSACGIHARRSNPLLLASSLSV